VPAADELGDAGSRRKESPRGEEAVEPLAGLARIDVATEVPPRPRRDAVRLLAPSRGVRQPSVFLLVWRVRALRVRMRPGAWDHERPRMLRAEAASAWI